MYSLSNLQNLEVLEVTGCNIDSDGVKTVLEGCKKLYLLNITNCIKVTKSAFIYAMELVRCNIERKNLIIVFGGQRIFPKDFRNEYDIDRVLEDIEFNDGFQEFEAPVHEYSMNSDDDDNEDFLMEEDPVAEYEAQNMS